MDAFTTDLNDLQLRLRRSASYDDVKYIRNAEIAGWGIAHHILHRAFDGIEGVPNRFRGSHFGRGWRRMFDWNEWMLPAAFQHEHNVHHVYTGAHEDPDVVEANVEFIRTS